MDDIRSSSSPKSETLDTKLGALYLGVSDLGDEDGFRDGSLE